VVDFNNDTTVATPPGEVVKIVVLERREQVIETLEEYHRLESSDVDTHHKERLVRARVMAFWYQIQAMVKRRLKGAQGTEDDPTYDMVEEEIAEAKEIDDLIDAFEWMNQFVDDMGLTFIDGRERYDRKRVEDANMKKGL
jgi:hypothetical protein